MTVDSEIARNDYLSDGVTTVFPYTFRILAKEEILVQVENVTAVLDQDYTVTGVGNQNGGTIVSHPVVPAGLNIHFRRNVPITQLLDLLPSTPVILDSAERAYDKLTMICQMIKDELSRRMPIFPDGEPGKYLRWRTITELENAVVVSAGSLSVGGDSPGRVPFWLSPISLTSDAAFFWDINMRRLKIARGFHEGAEPITPHKDGPLLVFLRNSDNVNGYQGILSTVHNGVPTDTLSTLGNDKVAIGGWTKRGVNGDSPIYGGNFGVVFTTPGVANGVEIDVQNDSGIDNIGQGLWINGSGSNHRANAILIDTQDTSKWVNGIHFTYHAAGGATGGILNAGILFEREQSQNQILIIPYDDINPSNNVFELRDASFGYVKAGIQKRGAFAGRGGDTDVNNPTFTFNDDPRTGMYQPGAGQIGFTTVGFLRMAIVEGMALGGVPDMGAGCINVSNGYFINGQRVIGGGRRGGWQAASGTRDRGGFDVATVSTTDLAKRVAAIIDDLLVLGLFGA